MVASLESTVSDLQTTTVHHTPSSESIPPDPVTRVPYEALGTMKINRPRERVPYEAHLEEQPTSRMGGKARVVGEVKKKHNM